MCPRPQNPKWSNSVCDLPTTSFGRRPIFNHPLSFAELSSDPTICSHLAVLYDTLLEQNLLRIVQLYNVMEIAYVAETVRPEKQAVKSKCVAPLQSFSCDRFIYLITDDGLWRLSQMILHKVFYGVLDQGHGCPLVYEKPEADVRPFLVVASFFFPLNFSPWQNTYEAAIRTLAEVGKIIESLYAMISNISFSLLPLSSVRFSNVFSDLCSLLVYLHLDCSHRVNQIHSRTVFCTWLFYLIIILNEFRDFMI